MIISKNSQLGLRFKEKNTKIDFLNLMKDYFEKSLGITKNVLERFEAIRKTDLDALSELEIQSTNEELDYINNIISLDGDEERETRNKVTDIIGIPTEPDEIKVLISDEGSSYYFICESVYTCAELIRVGDNFTGRTIKDIKPGKYTYLMGKHRMVRFICVPGAIRGFYYDDQKRIGFDWGIEMEDGKYFFERRYDNEFTMVMQVLAFVELGDIEVKILEAGRNNGGRKNIDKITNSSAKTVYVVDSTWNKLIIRTEGFAVRGHFRLQPCGEGMKDRKLIWIDAFEKHGYKRRPRAEIVKD